MEWVPEKYGDESRLDRLREYVKNSKKPVLGLSERTAIQVLAGKHVILSKSSDLVVKLFLPDPQSNGFAIHLVKIDGSDILPLLKPFL